jgi:putative flippase GtrA
MRHDAGLRRELRSFLRFCLVGAGGFLADGGVLALGVYLGGIGPLAGRAVSAPLAVLFTFALNRHWSFAGTAAAPVWRALLAYVGVQATGLAANLVVYTIAVALLPRPWNEPLVAFAVASAAALAVNYAGARLLVFRPPSHPASPPPPAA